MYNAIITVKNILGQVISIHAINDISTYDLRIQGGKGVYFMEIQAPKNKIEKIKIIKN